MSRVWLGFLGRVLPRLHDKPVLLRARENNAIDLDAAFTNSVQRATIEYRWKKIEYPKLILPRYFRLVLHLFPPLRKHFSEFHV